VGWFGDYSLVKMRIEWLALGRHRLDSESIKHSIQLLVDQIHATKKMPKLIRLTRFNRSVRLERSFQIVEHGQQLGRDVYNYAAVGFGTLALHPLTIVFEVCLPSRERVFQLLDFSFQT